MPRSDLIRHSCVNLLAIALWSLTTDKLGRHLIVNVLETFVVLICFIVGALYWTVLPPATQPQAPVWYVLRFTRNYALADTLIVGDLLLLDLCFAAYRHVVLPLLCRACRRPSSGVSLTRLEARSRPTHSSQDRSCHQLDHGHRHLVRPASLSSAA
jgi:hypothetical protein